MGEVLFRQGWWVKFVPTEEEADEWVYARVDAEADTVNPAREFRVRKFTPSGREPQAPEKTFDEVWPGPK